MKRNKGFTLIEVLLVVVILAILAAILLPGVVNYVARAHLAEFWTLVSAASTEAKLYRSENGTLVGYMLGSAAAVDDYDSKAGKKWDVTGMAGLDTDSWSMTVSKAGAPRAGEVLTYTYNEETGVAIKVDPAPAYPGF